MALYGDLIVKYYGAPYVANGKYTGVLTFDKVNPPSPWQAMDDAAQGLLDL